MKIYNKIILWLLTISVIFVLLPTLGIMAAENIPFNEASYTPVENISEVPESATVGIPLTLTGTVLPANTTYRNILWSIADARTTGATINGNILSSVSAGIVTVRATIINGTAIGVNYTQSFDIIVNPTFIPVTDITGVHETITADTPIMLAGTVLPVNATNKTIIWSIINPGTTGAVINGNILDTSAAGIVSIRATVPLGTTGGANFTKEFDISVNASLPTFIPVSNIIQVPITAVAGTSLTLTGAVFPFNATYQDILWNVINAGTTGATINGNILSTTSEGTATVRATIIDGEAVGINYTQDFNITVNGAFVPVTHIGGVATFTAAGMPRTLTGMVYPINATNQTIMWSIDNAGTTGATINGNALNAMSAGTVTVSATVVNGMAVGVNYTQSFGITVNGPASAPLLNAPALPTFIPVTNITGLPTETTAGTPLTLTYTVNPSNATNTTVIWGISDVGETGATIDGNTLNTESGGTALIRAVIFDGLAVGEVYTQEFSISVTAPPADSETDGDTLSESDSEINNTEENIETETLTNENEPEIIYETITEEVVIPIEITTEETVNTGVIDDTTLPQTGMLYAPIPMMIAFGVLMIIIGCISNFKREVKKLKPKIFISFVGVLSILSSIGVTAYNHWDDNRADIAAARTTKILYEYYEDESDYVDVDAPQLIEIEGEFYVGILSIPSLDLELPVNDKWSEEKLKDSPCRYAGSIDSSMVICAHNYAAHFGKLSELKYGDYVIIKDAKGTEHWYSVEVITTLRGTDVEPMINSIYDLTLFTCTSDGANRITVRCKKTSQLVQ